MDQSVKKMDEIEVRIAKGAANSWKKAMEGALAEGHSVVVGVDGKLIRIFPDRARRKIGVIHRRVRLRCPMKGPAKWKTESQA
jgi:hypothetical protein